ncbi:hypothetical protein [Streptomyces sp. NPDC051704]
MAGWSDIDQPAIVAAASVPSIRYRKHRAGQCGRSMSGALVAQLRDEGS